MIKINGGWFKQKITRFFFNQSIKYKKERERRIERERERERDKKREREIYIISKYVGKNLISMNHIFLTLLNKCLPKYLLEEFHSLKDAKTGNPNWKACVKHYYTSWHKH